MTEIPAPGRPPTKQREITETVRAWILEGTFGPGDRLPLRSSLEERFAASRVTVQRVFDQLAADGLITTRGRGGTRVSDRPPHQHRIAMVFPSSVRRPRFWTALIDQASRLKGEWDVTCIEGVDRIGDPGYQELLADVHAGRLAGIIFGSDVQRFAGSELLQAAVARIALTTGPGDLGLPVLYPDQHSFTARALDHLVAQGCKRIACLIVPRYPVAMVRDELRRRGIDDQTLVQAVPLRDPEWAEPLTRVLLAMEVERRPDGLLIADDNMVEHATAGILAAGYEPGRDIEVVAHCNFPLVAPGVLPIRRLGYDASEVLQRCLDGIAQQRAGASVQRSTTIGARFENELLNRDHANSLRDVS